MTAGQGRRRVPRRGHHCANYVDQCIFDSFFHSIFNKFKDLALAPQVRVIAVFRLSFTTPGDDVHRLAYTETVDTHNMHYTHRHTPWAHRTHMIDVPHTRAA